MKEYNMKINGNAYVVAVDVDTETSASVIVNGTKYKVELEDAKVKTVVASKPQVAAVPASHPVTNLASPAGASSNGVASVAAAPGDKVVTSPLPGVILDIKVAVGDTVTAGQTLIVLEAMKMENNVDSSYAGVVKSIQTKCGNSVLEGDALITIG